MITTAEFLRGQRLTWSCYSQWLNLWALRSVDEWCLSWNRMISLMSSVAVLLGCLHIESNYSHPSNLTIELITHRIRNTNSKKWYHSCCNLLWNNEMIFTVMYALVPLSWIRHHKLSDEIVQNNLLEYGYRKSSIHSYATGIFERAALAKKVFKPSFYWLNKSSSPFDALINFYTLKRNLNSQY